MKIEILRPVMISGEPADAGSILEVDDSAAVTLLGLGKAVEHKAEAPAPAAEEEAPACPPKKPTTRKRTKES
jgi:hypothetical protein|tara:strand:- start:203 stop:418 length:216 start_codon:yes stop_codon:yes gene_type:complete